MDRTGLAQILMRAVQNRSPLEGRSRMGSVLGAAPEWPPQPNDPLLTPPPPENPNAVQDEALERWLGRKLFNKPQIDRELNTLQPQELEQWKLNDQKQLDAMSERFQFSPRRTSR